MKKKTCSIICIYRVINGVTHNFDKYVEFGGKVAINKINELKVLHKWTVFQCFTNFTHKKSGVTIGQLVFGLPSMLLS